MGVIGLFQKGLFTCIWSIRVPKTREDKQRATRHGTVAAAGWRVNRTEQNRTEHKVAPTVPQTGQMRSFDEVNRTEQNRNE